MAHGAMEQWRVRAELLLAFTVAMAEVGFLAVSTCRTLKRHLIKFLIHRMTVLKSLQPCMFFSFKDEKIQSQDIFGAFQDLESGIHSEVVCHQILYVCSHI